MDPVEGVSAPPAEGAVPVAFTHLCWSSAGVGPVDVDRQTAGAHERPPPLGRHPAGLPAGVGGHGVRLQPGDSHRLPAHPVCTGTTRVLGHDTHAAVHALNPFTEVAVIAG